MNLLTSFLRNENRLGERFEIAHQTSALGSGCLKRYIHGFFKTGGVFKSASASASRDINDSLWTPPKHPCVSSARHRTARIVHAKAATQDARPKVQTKFTSYVETYSLQKSRTSF